MAQNPIDESHPQISIINTFIEITSCPSKSQALFFLESHNFDLDAAVSTFFDNPDVIISDAVEAVEGLRTLGGSPAPEKSRSRSQSQSQSQYSPSDSLSPVSDYRSRSPPSPVDGRTYNLRSSGGQRRLGGRVRARDSNDREDAGMDSDPDFDPMEDGNDLGRRVRARGRSNANDANANSRNFTGFSRLVSGEDSSTPLQSEAINHNVWNNQCSVDGRTEAFSTEQINSRGPFQSPGKTRSSNTMNTEANTIQVPFASAPTPTYQGVIVDQSQPSTSVQIRLVDGTRVISRFNTSHTIRDVRAFVDSSSTGVPRTYLLQTMDFPPKQLTDLDQTIEESGIANSVLIQRL